VQRLLRQTIPLLVLLTGAVLCFALLRAAPLVAEKLLPWMGASPPDWQVECLFLLLIFAPLLALGFAARRLLHMGHLPRGRHKATHLIGGLVVGIAGMAATIGILAAFGGVQSLPIRATALLPLAIGTLIILLQTSAEEVFFRGWIQTAVSRYWGKWPAILAASLLFAAVHSINEAIGWMALANIFLAGVFFGKLFRFSGGILAPIAAHFGWNWAETILLGASPNPGVGPYGSMFDLDLKGAAMFGGSDQGVNASLALGIVLLLLIALVILSRRAKGIVRTPPLAVATPVAESAVPQAPVRNSSSPRTGLRVQDDAVTNVGKVRQVNEDSMFASTELGVWTVADGMGGHEYGERASKAIVDAVATLEPVNDFQTKVDKVREAILAANAEIYAEAQERGQRMGSTVVSLVLKDDDFAVMWAGDSRAYLYRDNKLTQVSRDHTQVQSLIDRGLLAPEDAAGHPMSHVLARAIGVMAQVDVDVVRDKVRPGDVFLLCSDGLYGLVSDDEIAEYLIPSRLSGAADALIALSLERGAPDNITVIAVSASEVTLLSFGKDRTDGM
jgi:serine/threonine protein phosphatase Stp1